MKENIEQRIKQYLEERNKGLEEERRKTAENLLSKVWDFQKQYPKKEVEGFVLRNTTGCFEMIIQLKNSANKGFGTGGENYQIPVLKYVKEILEKCGVNCSDIEVGKDFEVYY